MQCDGNWLLHGQQKSKEANTQNKDVAKSFQAIDTCRYGDIICMMLLITITASHINQYN